MFGSASPNGSHPARRHPPTVECLESQQ